MTDMLASIGYYPQLFNVTNEYDSSFLKRNNILSRIAYCSDSHAKSVDLMIVASCTTVQRVVQNFDLTFCEAWYDGFSVHASEPMDFMNKKGHLRKDYLESFIGGNYFILERINKYKKRGFTIEIDLSSFSKNAKKVMDSDPKSNRHCLIQMLKQVQPSLPMFSHTNRNTIIKALIAIFLANNESLLLSLIGTMSRIYLEIPNNRDAILTVHGNIYPASPFKRADLVSLLDLHGINP
jgi:hypothetical protein